MVCIQTVSICKRHNSSCRIRHLSDTVTRISDFLRVSIGILHLHQIAIRAVCFFISLIVTQGKGIVARVFNKFCVGVKFVCIRIGC
ncbi:hypothetical protein SDC9_172141 [bioreactor metagenome]|uniref:Uncharacterized protein n=1 Tax=bioreactor metagenome TaxID=1076179 RepID=A0A645GG31_9ZZZZ